MAVYKILFAGPVGSGKTTAIQSLSDIEVVRTEAGASDHVRNLKATTTVAMDFGLMKLASGDQVRLYGTPGQKRFDFMWDILAENALGLVLLIDASAPAPLDDLRTYLHEFRALIDRSAVVVGVTHAEAGEWDTRQRIGDEMTRLGIVPTVMHADARERAHMAALVQSLIFAIDPLAGADAGAPELQDPIR
ncbi:MAG: ATP/GTP-binding protein [Variovorax sp.]|nr:ATP/GTP-binding protein [Variovorax sp.]